LDDIDKSLLDVTKLMTPIELNKCELVNEKGKQTFIEVGNALCEICDKKRVQIAVWNRLDKSETLSISFQLKQS